MQHKVVTLTGTSMDLVSSISIDGIDCPIVVNSASSTSIQCNTGYKQGDILMKE